MTLRERILVSLSVAAVIGAGIYALWPQSPQRTETGDEELDQVVAVMESQLQKLDLDTREERILGLLDSPLPTGMLKAAPEEEEPLAPQESLPRYSGYVRIGERMLAILDGREYVPGETVRGRMLRLREIHAGEVILEDKSSGEQVHIELEQEQK